MRLDRQGQIAASDAAGGIGHRLNVALQHPVKRLADFADFIAALQRRLVALFGGKTAHIAFRDPIGRLDQQRQRPGDRPDSDAADEQADHNRRQGQRDHHPQGLPGKDHIRLALRLQAGLHGLAGGRGILAHRRPDYLQRTLEQLILLGVIADDGLKTGDIGANRCFGFGQQLPGASVRQQ